MGLVFVPKIFLPRLRDWQSCGVSNGINPSSAKQSMTEKRSFCIDSY